jgi:FixJ family two-component response regulator
MSPSGSQVPASVAKTITTLIVLDDDDFVCRALKAHLEILGFEVLVFNSGEAMLASVFPIQHTCLLADVYLPGISAIEVDRRLKSAGKYLPTILMSGRDDPETMRMMRSAKPVARLFKPFDPQALERAISQAIRHGSKN